MKHFLFSLLLSTLVQVGFAQKIIQGKLVDDFNEPLSDALVFVNEIHQAYTDCEGEFKVMAFKGDTLTFSKPRYLTRIIVVRPFQDYNKRLTYDYALAKQKLRNEYPQLMDTTSGGGSQPLFVVNSEPYIWSVNYTTKLNLTKKNVKSVELLKGYAATARFGWAASNGLIWIHLVCREEKR